MEEKVSLSMQDMEKASGGTGKTIHTRSATVYAAAGTEYGTVRTLNYGDWVNFTGAVSYSDRDGRSYYEINAPVHGWVTKEALGV